MITRSKSERAILMQEKCQTLLKQMLRNKGNEYCVDCDAIGPRWASWNLGVFLCTRCAGIHRSLGVHISQVKSVNLDLWTPEQVVSLQQMGNSRSKTVYEAQLSDRFRRPKTDAALKSFIRAKYEHKTYLAREWVPPPPPKVDWTKEIDEEIEKQRKKQMQRRNTLGGFENVINNESRSRKGSLSVKQSSAPAPLPKPKYLNSPKGYKTKNNQQNSSDLLGLSSPVNSSEQNKKLNEGGEGFSGFLSAPVVSENFDNNTSLSRGNEKNCEQNSLAKEEENFFKQSNCSSNEKEKENNSGNKKKLEVFDKQQDVLKKKPLNKNKIMQMHPGITREELLKICRPTELLCLEDIYNFNIHKFFDDLMNYNPSTFKDILIYYKTVCALFLFSNTYPTTIISCKTRLLHKAFIIDIDDFDNPVILHLICKSLAEVLENTKNLIFFSRKISSISRTSFYLATCLMWTGLFNLLKIEKPMHRFHKFSTLIELLEKFELDKNKTNLNDLYMVLEIVSFLDIAILTYYNSYKSDTKSKNKSTPYNKYFKYTNDELLKLKSWCKKVITKFGDSLIIEIVEFDIIPELEDALEISRN